MIQTLAIDMDDVLADCASRVLAVYREVFDTTVDPALLQGKHLPQPVDPARAKTVYGYLHRPGFFRSLPVMPDSQAVVRQLYECYEVYIVSAAMEFPNSLAEKYDWLQEHFPFIGWERIVFCGHKTIIGTDMLIDDHEKNLVNFKGKPVLYTAAHNIYLEGYTRVKNWQEVADMLLG